MDIAAEVCGALRFDERNDFLGCGQAIAERVPQRCEGGIGQALNPGRRSSNTDLVPERLSENPEHEEGRHPACVELAVSSEAEEHLEEGFGVQGRSKLLTVPCLLIRTRPRSDAARPEGSPPVLQP